MLKNYSDFTTALITQGTFIDSDYLGEFTNGAYYLIIIGSVCAALALLTLVMHSNSGSFCLPNSAQRPAEAHRALFPFHPVRRPGRAHAAHWRDDLDGHDKKGRDNKRLHRRTCRGTGPTG